MALGLEFQEIVFNEENIEMFTSIQNSVAHPKTFKMGYVKKSSVVSRLSDAKAFFIKEDGKIVGTLEYVLISDDSAYIRSIAVSKKFQNKGIGRSALLLLLYGELKDVSKVDLTTHPKNKALNLYLSLGFVVVKKIRRNKFLGHEPYFHLSLEMKLFDNKH